MLFNSLDFAIFLPIVLAIYWLTTRWGIRFQNLFLVMASYVFYGWWDVRFLGLILFSSCLDYAIGIGLSRTNAPHQRKRYLWLSISVNLGLLGVFKYYNFFIENFNATFSVFGSSFELSSLQLILPVGISFYTFQTLSYSIDVYKKKLKATRDFISFLAYVSFFPQLVAGPIERATHLLPQFQSPRSIDTTAVQAGLRQMLWGFFKKLVIADNCATYANMVFNDAGPWNGSTQLLGAFMFAFQIYGDFSGYSDIAIGTARLFGFDLMKNFAFPYFSRDIAEFWRRWHISLTTWFRDYLYIPLGGSQGGLSQKVRNIFIIFLVSGFWHGANWTFLVWGALNAIYFLPLLLIGKNRAHLDTVAKNSLFPSATESFKMALTFGLTLIAWIFFRAENLTQAMACLGQIFSISLLHPVQIHPGKFCVILFFFIGVEWLNRNKSYGLAPWTPKTKYAPYLDFALLCAVFWMVVLWNTNTAVEFIYFQF
ncbi:MAG: MBOAT family protein [Acidobacteria bacterium]|nr:MBOAT family protein [Acidobacteriota bacterium]